MVEFQSFFVGFSVAHRVCFSEYLSPRRSKALKDLAFLLVYITPPLYSTGGGFEPCVGRRGVLLMTLLRGTSSAGRAAGRLAILRLGFASAGGYADPRTADPAWSRFRFFSNGEP